MCWVRDDAQSGDCECTEIWPQESLRNAESKERFAINTFSLASI